MRSLSLLIMSLFVLSCNVPMEDSVTEVTSIHEQFFLELGGQEQYVEISGKSEQLPVMLFLHGGPGWLQTPHLRYFNSALSDEMIVVSWDQAGCGKSYIKNPTPDQLSPESLMEDAHELTRYLKERFHQEKIILVGFSYGSVLGLQLVEKYPEDYAAYVGVSQLIDYQKNWETSIQWIKDQAKKQGDVDLLDEIDRVGRRDPAECASLQECFMRKYRLIVKYKGAIYDEAIQAEIEKAEHFNSDYQDYDWFAAFTYTTSRIGDQRFQTDLSHITALSIPVYYMAGRHDWNLPGIVTEAYFQTLQAPEKEFICLRNRATNLPRKSLKLSIRV